MADQITPSSLPDPERTDPLFPLGPDAGGATDRTTDFPADEGTAEIPALGPLPPAVGRFPVTREVARGGMGVIYSGRDVVMWRAVALKVLLEIHLGKPGYRERLVEEARMTAALRHPGIVPVYEVGELPDGRPFFAMDLIDGPTLDTQLAARKNLTDDLPRFLQVFERICQVIAYAHSRGVIHCDLKPSNVMTALFGVVKVIDWGLARPVPGSTFQLPGEGESRSAATLSPARPAEAGGTPSYMSPEQATGGRLDERTDVFGLGGILCAILTGQPPYPGKNFRQVCGQARRAELGETFARLNASPAARELVALAKQCLSPHAPARPRDAQEVLASLTAYIESDLRRVERDLVRFFEFTLDLCCIARTDGFFRHVNANFTRVLGYSAAELTSRPFVEFVHPDDRANTHAEAAKLTRGLPVVQFRNRYRHVNGSYRWFEWVAQSIPDEGIIFAVARDITDRMEAEARQRTSTDPGAAS